MVFKKGKSKAQTKRQQREADESRAAAEASAPDAADGNADDAADAGARTRDVAAAPLDQNARPGGDVDRSAQVR